MSALMTMSIEIQKKPQGNKLLVVYVFSLRIKDYIMKGLLFKWVTFSEGGSLGKVLLVR